MIATVVGILTIILAIWIQRTDKRSWMRKLGWAALGAVVAQGLLGGMTVLMLQPPAVSTAHACLAQLFFSMTVAIALFTSRGWQQEQAQVEDYGRPRLRTLAIIAPMLVLCQIALGAAFRHRALSLLPHILGAVVVTVAILFVAMFVLQQFGKHPTLRKAATALLAITSFQVLLGVGAYYTRAMAAELPLAMVLTTVAHVAAGGLTLASTFVLSIQIRRNVQSPVAIRAVGSQTAVAR
jgi:cytochrome c oxidase assembly protein subunit 15